MDAPEGMAEEADQTLLGGSDRLVLGEERVHGSEKFGGALVADEGGGGVDSKFERIHARDGLTLRGARAGRLGGVAAVGSDLLTGSHKKRQPDRVAFAAGSRLPEILLYDLTVSRRLFVSSGPER